MANVRANIPKIYLYKLLSEFWVIVPILIPYYKSHGLNSTQVFTIQAAYALSILIFEIPSGYLADVIGRRKTLILGAVFLPLGLCVYTFFSSFYTFLLAEFIFAIGNSMRSGCDSALIYDSLIQLKQESQYKKIQGRAFFFPRIGSSFSSILGGLLALVSLRMPFFINIGTSLLILPVALSLVEPERKKPEAANPFKNILKISRFCFSDKNLRLLILLAALIMSTGITGIWSYFLYYESLGINIGFFGIIFAGFQLSSAFGASNSHKIDLRIGEKKSLTSIMLISLTFTVLGLVRSIYLLPLIFLNAFIWGFTFPIILDIINREIKSEIRATVLSVANMSGSFSFVVLSPLFGKMVDVLSLSTSYLIIGGYVFVYGALVLIVYFFRQEN